MIMVVLAVLVGLGAAGLFAYGRDRAWTEMFGPPDLGPYDFELPTRTGKLNDALFCPPATPACEAAAVDRTIPLLATDAAALLAEVRRVVEAMPGAVIVDDRPERLAFRAVVRTPVMRFPDTLSVRVRQEAPGVAGLWLYSRSQIGHADLGANGSRLRKIVRAVRRAFETAEPAS